MLHFRLKNFYNLVNLLKPFFSCKPSYTYAPCPLHNLRPPSSFWAQALVYSVHHYYCFVLIKTMHEIKFLHNKVWPVAWMADKVLWWKGQEWPKSTKQKVWHKGVTYKGTKQIIRLELSRMTKAETQHRKPT